MSEQTTQSATPSVPTAEPAAQSGLIGTALTPPPGVVVVTSMSPYRQYLAFGSALESDVAAVEASLAADFDKAHATFVKWAVFFGGLILGWILGKVF